MITFHEFVAQKEGTNVQYGQNQNGVNPDQLVDDEITKTPKLLQTQAQAGKNMVRQQKVINQAIQNRRQNRGVSLDAALKAASMADKRLN